MTRRAVRHLLIGLMTLAAFAPAAAAADADSRLTSETFAGLELRGIGPALMSGRIADIAIHPENRSTWYVAAGSGGVWKTTNAGTTWTPIFDDQPSYSIGCLALDPGNPEVVWVGTGENVSGRHVGWGDGVYRSADGGATWSHVGLAASEHLAKIVVDPRDPQVVFVAAEGPLWSSGGERGVYKTTDGGASWELALDLGADTGATDLEIDPRDPDVLYAAAFQRRRHIWSYLAGGQGSGIYKSTDGGASWRELTRGLPSGDMGKIGLAVSPVDPDVVYATIEAGDEERGFYRSTDRGESWEKRSDYLSNGTGPHYYQEIYASPHERDRVYQMDVWIHVTEDGGKSFAKLGEQHKHSDNHALAFDPADPDYLLAGSDGGLYESFDHAASWKFVANLPLTQIYKMAVDDDRPVYHVIGGTQDNGTQWGPSRTLSVHGIRNRDWQVPLGADGYACAADPQDPNLLYAEWQRGNLVRFDRRSGERIHIQPQPAAGEPPERWNWDAPLLLSPHSPERLYYGSQRLWRSDDRGDSWLPLSGDLTRGRNRYELELMGRVWSVDDLYDNTAMSWYGTLTALAESPRVEGLLYAGSDDGLVQVSEDGGASWRRVEVPGAPELAFVNDLVASSHDPDAVFAVFDNHKLGDFAPYLFRSRDRGRTWSSIAGDLPGRHVLWSLVEDHRRPGLLFVGSEYGIHFTLDGGGRWIELSAAPTIAFRDLAIQRREDDLVGASFGRGFWILDDYSPLREVSEEALAEEALLFTPRDALWYLPANTMATRGRAYQGGAYFSAPNPPHGAVFTYYLRDEAKSARELRRERDGELREAGDDVPFPGWQTLREEALESEARVVLTVRDAEGAVVRRIGGPAASGFHRVAWDLHYPSPEPIEIEPPGELPPWASPPRGPLAPPGRYSVELARLDGGELTPLAGPRQFSLTPLDNQSLPAMEPAAALAFARRAAELQRRLLAARERLEESGETLEYLEKAALETPAAEPELLARVGAARRQLAELERLLVTDDVRREYWEPSPPSVLDRVSRVVSGQGETRGGATATHRRELEVAETAWAELAPRLRSLVEEELPAIERALEAAGAPWTPGRQLP